MKKRFSWFRPLVALVIGLVMTASLAASTDRAQAADGRDFNAGMIMSDSVFYDGDSMSVAEIQAFLNSKVLRCTGTAQPCLKNFSQSTGATELLPNRCWDIPAMREASAAQIIYAVGRACSINPKVLLVLLEKEQGLVTSTAPSANKYRIATGYGCPDTAACDTRYYGFFNQVWNAAKQFQTYRQSASAFRYKAGRMNTIQWSPDGNCGSSQVYIENVATAGLYNYTPYRPNAAALNNMYGTGDRCSAYGNRNFWRIHMDWFGTTFYASEATTGIHDLWVRTGGDTGTLGRATSALYCAASGCKRHFANGIAYSPIGGTFGVTGGHATKYMQAGETGGRLGFPRSDEIRNVSGSYIAFENGYSMWSPSTGVHTVTGGHASRYAASGGSQGPLGYPMSDELATGSNGTYVKFERGLSIWSPSSGLRVLSADHSANYQSLGGSEGKVGYPTSDVMATGSGGTWVTYQNGISVWSAKTGVAQLPGGHAVSYGKVGGSESQYGYPVTNEKLTPSGGSYVQFQRGFSIWSPRSGVQLLDEQHGAKYASLGGTQSKLGYPIGGVTVNGDGGSYVAYQGGYTLRSKGANTFSVPAGHGLAYAASGGSNGPLGYPTSDEIATGTGTVVAFQRGISAWSPSTPVVLVAGGYAEALSSAGGVAGPLGYPTGPVRATSSGGTLTFQSGSIVYDSSRGDYTVSR